MSTYELTDYACCQHCRHETDGGPPHEDPCPESGCTVGQQVARTHRLEGGHGEDG
jgi:hypothetical protein